MGDYVCVSLAGLEKRLLEMAIAWRQFMCDPCALAALTQPDVESRRRIVPLEMILPAASRNAATVALLNFIAPRLASNCGKQNADGARVWEAAGTAYPNVSRCLLMVNYISRPLESKGWRSS
jgi:hypothetical protein